MVFGVFDRLHPGHLSFLMQARKYGELVVVVARDAAVEALKNKKPKEGEKKRVRAIKKFPFVSHVCVGDKAQGSYSLLKKWKPDVICFGYDQKMLKRDLQKHMQRSGVIARFIQLKPYRPEKFHSSKMEHYGK